MIDYLLMILVIAPIGIIIGFIVSLFCRNLCFGVLLFYIFSTLIYQLEGIIPDIISGKFTLKDFLPSFFSAFQFYIFVNTFIALPFFILSWIFCNKQKVSKFTIIGIFVWIILGILILTVGPNIWG